MTVRVTNVKGLNTPEQRAAVCYVGRRFAGWPGTPYGNHDRLPCPDEFRRSLLALPESTLLRMLASLWVACEQGAKPLGCWCLTWDGVGPTPGCHAAVWAELLNQRYGGGS
jgi:hypothetical protein